MHAKVDNMDRISTFLAAPETVYYLIGVLVVIALIFMLTFHRIVTKSEVPLKQAYAIIETTQSKEAFATQYTELVDRISVLFRKHRNLREQWIKFQRHLTRNDQGIICGYFEPERFFNPNLLHRSRWAALCKAAPGYLVGIGLVFTFLGIAVVIHRASIALGSSNDIQAIQELLNAAGSKFWTSLVGVAFSIITSAAIHWRTAGHIIAAAEFSRSLSERIFFLSPEYSLHLTNILQSQQINALKDLSGTVLHSGKDAAREIIFGFKSFEEGMKSITKDTFSDLVHRSTSELSNAIEVSLKGVAQTFVTVNEQLESIVQRIQPLPENFGNISESIIKASVATNLQFDESVRHLSDNFGKAKLLSAEINADFSSSAGHAEEIRKVLTFIPDSLVKATASLEHLGRLDNVSQRLHESAAAVRSASDSLLASWKQQADHVSSIDAKLGHTVATLPTVFTQYSEGLKKFSEDFENHLIRVLGSLSSQIEALESSQNSLRGVAESLHAASIASSNSSTETL
jgi:hypothetical protein